MCPIQCWALGNPPIQEFTISWPLFGTSLSMMGCITIEGSHTDCWDISIILSEYMFVEAEAG